jgi:hypothetical protein
MISSYNILYIANALYEAITGVSLSDAQMLGLGVLQKIEWWLVGLGLFFLLLFIFLKLKEATIEHHMHHERLEGELAVAKKENTRAKNPRFQQVIALAQSGHESDWRRAILEADSMLRDMLSEKGFVGEDVGEQLRGASKSHFATLDLAWEAHRLRNKIAHEGESLKLTDRDATATIDLYRRVFEEFKYV